MKLIKNILIVSILFTVSINAQVSKTSELFLTLKSNDSLLFEIGFNKCDINQFKKLIADDFEFYHDKSGITNTKNEFMKGITNGLCNASNQTRSRRELVEGSLTVFPLFNNGKLYGAIQKGEHKFFESFNGNPESKGSLAKFSHLWIIDDNGSWKVKRVLSYDHQMQQ